MMKIMRIFLPAVGIMGIAAAATSAAGPQAGPVMPDPVKAVFRKACVDCHKGEYAPRGLDLEASKLPGSILDVPSREQPDLKLVNTADPEMSYLLKKVRGAPDISGKRMPLPPKPALSQADLNLLESWISGLKAGVAASE
jgi:cytochrome c551/c552